MTKSEIEKLIEYIDNTVQKRAFDERYHNGNEFVEKGVQVYCKVNDVYDLLREYPVEPEKTCSANYEAMYEEAMAKIADLQEYTGELENDARMLNIKMAKYRGAIAMVELLYGRVLNV